MADIPFTSYLSKDELAVLRRPSDLAGWWTVAVDWGLIALAFALLVMLPNPLTFVVAVLILGGRQLALGIVVHDCAHGSLFTSPRTNRFVGEWLAAVPTGSSLIAYRDYHLQHHRHAGTADDPDIGFVAAYPISRASLRRKLLRDLTGRTALRDMMLAAKAFRLRRRWPSVAFHALLLATLTAAGAPWAYAAWWVARIFAYPLIVRLRQIGEHGVAIARGDPDPRRNTSTTLTAWWERLLIAPNHVGYHLEHHLAAGVPGHKLGRMHRLLRARGFYDGYASISSGYIDVLRRAVRHDPAAA